MNKNKVILVSVILNILLIGICISSNTNIVLNNEKQIIKEMTEGEYESKLTELNKSHTDYALQVQENKQKLATAITNQKVTTSEDATIDQMVTNIGKILQNRTSDATATAEDIAIGKTAYVNGELVTGLLSSLNNGMEILYEGNYVGGTVYTFEKDIERCYSIVIGIRDGGTGANFTGGTFNISGTVTNLAGTYSRGGSATTHMGAYIDLLTDVKAGDTLYYYSANISNFYVMIVG